MGRTASFLVAVVLILIGLGVVMLASTSITIAQARGYSPLYYVWHQMLWILVGSVVAFAAARIDYHAWGRPPWPWVLVGVSYALLVAVLLVGATTKGSVRWIRFGGIGFQPSELAKFSVIVFVAWWMSRARHRTQAFVPGLLIPAGTAGGILLLVLAEPDFGTSMMIGLLVVLLLFLGGARVLYLGAAAVTAACVFTLAILQNSERMRRILAFLNPEKYARTEAFQLLNAIYAFVVGGAWGVGLGESLQKQYYLPEAHTDFIFAIVGEELGLAGSLLVLLLYGCLFVLGARISSAAPDRFGRLLGWGLTLAVTLQALVNIAVVTGCLPTKGLPLPFISYGGSNMVISLLMIGVLVNIGLCGGGGCRRAIRDALREV